MLKIKRILSLALLLIGGLAVALLPTDFSVAQNYGPTDEDLLGKRFSFRMPNVSLYLYAMTEPNTYIIHFDGNGSTAGSMSNMDMVYDVEKNLLANNFVRDGYTFKGWSITPVGEVEYLDQAEIKNLTADKLGEVILYAQRMANIQVPYVIEYYQENIAGTGYDLVGTGIEYGPAGPQVITTGNTYTGFTLQTGAEVDITSGGIVPYYYTRNTYNLVVKDRDNVLVNTGIKYGADIPLPSDPEWTGNTFSGWDNLPADGKMPASDIEITSIWTYGVHSITFDTNGGSEVETITGNYGDIINKPENPTREGYVFVGWEPEIPDTMPYDDVIIKAKWREKKSSSGGGWSGGGGRKGGTLDISPGGSQHESADDQTEPTKQQTQPRRGMADLDTFFAYMWAHDMGIIEESWEDSDPDGYVTRGAMAEMVVKFSETVLGTEIPAVIPEHCAWGDSVSEWKTLKTKVYAEKACALGVMGIRMQNFMPNKILDRAEFGTILSRLLWGDKYDVVDATETKLYYTRHLQALKDNKIMTEIDNPTEKKELRKWAWLMLMRSRIEERLAK